MRVIHSGETVPKNLPAASPIPKVTGTKDEDTKQWIQAEPTAEMGKFVAAGETEKHHLIPIYQIRDQRYSIYWQTRNSNRMPSL